jgi:hypothetical protein
MSRNFEFRMQMRIMIEIVRMLVTKPLGIHDSRIPAATVAVLRLHAQVLVIDMLGRVETFNADGRVFSTTACSANICHIAVAYQVKTSFHGLLCGFMLHIRAERSGLIMASQHSQHPLHDLGVRIQ